MSQPSISRFFKPAGNKRSQQVRLGSQDTPISIDHDGEEENVLGSIDDDVTSIKQEDTTTETQSFEATFARDISTVNIDEFKHQKAGLDRKTNEYLNSKEKQLVHEKFVKKLKNHNMLRKRSPDINEEPNDADADADEAETPSRTSVLKRHKKCKLTPLDTQLLELKKQHQDKILAINVGYKYKFFGPDARICASILNIMMIPGKESVNGDNPNDDLYDKYAYCSIPENRLHIHLKRLISRGHKVGVVEQTETAAIKSLSSTRNSLFERRLTNVYTSATYVEDDGDDSLFGSRGGDYVASIVETAVAAQGLEDSDDNVVISIVSINPVNGEIVYDTFEDDYVRTQLETRLYHLQPSEYVVFDTTSPKTLKKLSFYQKTNQKVRINKIRAHVNNVLEISYADKLFEYCEQNILDGNRGVMVEFLSSLPKDVRVCCMLLIDYLKDFRLDSAFQIRENYETFKQATCMLLNSNTLSALEIFENSTTHTEQGSLIGLLDHTKTVFGYRLLKQWVSQPLIDRERIEERLEAITNMKETNLARTVEVLSNMLNGLPDMEKLLSRIHYRRSKRKEIYSFLKSIDTILTMVKDNILGQTVSQTKSPLLQNVFANMQIAAKDLYFIVKKFLETIDIQYAMDTKDQHTQATKFFNYKSEYFPEIAKVHEIIQKAEQELQSELKNVRHQLGKPHLQYRHIAKEEYLIEVSRVNSRRVPNTWVKINDTRTLIRYRSPNVIEQLKQLNYQRAVLLNVCERVFQDFLGKVDEHYLQLRFLIKQLAVIDCLFSLTAASINANDYVRPHFVDEKIISVKDGRNPIIESLITSTYIPNDINMRHTQNRALVLTGPNMGGKSSYVRQIALIVIMAQIGCYVPASSAVLGLFDSVFTRMGFNDNVLKGESTFMVEMNECCNIIRNCTSQSLVILDEVGRGTGTTDGVSIAYGILDYLLSTENKQPLTLFITHYTELCDIAKRYPTIVRNVHMAYTEQKTNDNIGNVTFLYNVVDGYAKNSYGLNVAKLSSIPGPIIDKALIISRNLERKISNSRDVHWALNARDVMLGVLKDDHNTFKKLVAISDRIEESTDPVLL